MSHGRTFVVLSHQGMGDSLMAVAMLRACDEALQPGDKMVILVKSPLEVQVMNTIPWRGNVEIWQLQQGRILGKIRLYIALPKLRRLRPDVLIAPLVPDRWTNALLMWLIGARKTVVEYGRWLGRLGRTVPVHYAPQSHEAEEFIEYARAAGVDVTNKPDIVIPVTEDVRKAARQGMPGWSPEQKWIAFGPGSGELEQFKRWPPQHYARLAELLLNHSPNVRIAMFGSPGERPLLESIYEAISCEHHRCHLFTDQSFAECLAFLTQCHCMVAAAAGLSHMAASAGIPIVGVHGPANPGHSGPFSDRLRVVRLDLECSPCWRYKFTRGCGNPICMTMISPETVFEAVLASLDGKPCPPVPWCETTDATEAVYPQSEIKDKAA